MRLVSALENGIKCSQTGARMKAWCLLIHTEASFFLVSQSLLVISTCGSGPREPASNAGERGAPDSSMQRMGQRPTASGGRAESAEGSRVLLPRNASGTRGRGGAG